MYQIPQITKTPVTLNQYTVKTVLITCLILIFYSIKLNSQMPKNKYVFLELAGSGGIGSINYEQDIWQKRKAFYTFRAGLSLAPIDKNNGTGLVFPLMFNSILGQRKNKLELGIGQGLTVTTKGNWFLLTTAGIGLRHQSAASPIFYRITYTPLISYLVDFQTQHWAGFSIGYKLKYKSK